MNMTENLLNQIIVAAQEVLARNTRYHDIGHALEVLENTKLLAKNEPIDTVVLYSAALLHDISNFQGGKKEDDDGARMARQILGQISAFPREQIDDVEILIKSINGKPLQLAEIILNDADELAAFSLLSLVRGSMLNAQRGMTIRENILDLKSFAKKKYLHFQNPEKTHLQKARELAEVRYVEFEKLLEAVLQYY